MYDLVLSGGTVASAADTFAADIGITDGRIAALGTDLAGHDRIDARGRLVLPGGIEAHCHIAQESATGGMTADDYTSGSISAAFGGNSCFVPFAAQHRGMGVTETLDLYDGRADGASVIDYGYHLIVADPTEKVLTEELPAAFKRGVTSFKVFMTYDLMRIDDRQFLDILTVARENGALTMVHAENSGMIAWMSDRLVAGGHTAPRYHAVSHPALAEAEAVNRAISLARLVDAPLLIVHVSTPEGADLVGDARRAGAKIFGETCAQYLFLTRDDLDRPGMEGAKFMCSPPLRDAGTQEALWRHLQAGTFSVFSSDHAPYRFDESGKLAKGSEATFKQIANGMPGIALRLPLLFSRGVNERRLTLQQFVALSATNAARLYGLTRKGSVAIGMDADLAIWDPNETRRVTVADQHDNMDYSPYDGWSLTGWPVTVLSRGARVIENGALVGAPGHGRFVARDRIDLTGIPGHRAVEMDPATNFGAKDRAGFGRVMRGSAGPIVVVNPNSNAAVTDGLVRALAPFRLTGGPGIECMTLAEGPFGIESQVHSDQVVLPLVDLVRARRDAAAFVIACYSDPGLDACRSVSPVPVFGIQESGVLAALARADRIGIIGISSAAERRHRLYMRRMGVLDRVAGERALDMSVDETARGAGTLARLIEVGASLRAEGAQALVLGCAGLALHRAPLETELGIPVIDPTQAAVAMALGGILAARL